MRRPYSGLQEHVADFDFNIGSKVIEKGGGSLGFEFSENQAESQYNRIKSLVNEELKQYFRPEFSESIG